MTLNLEMSLLNIKLHEPQSLADALKLLRELEDMRVLAGGTDLLVEIKEGSTEAKHILSLQKIKTPVQQCQGYCYN